MELKMTQSMVQKQTLVMTPKLQQAIKILQMPRMELSQYISQQLEENPFLEENFDEIEEISEESEIKNESDETLIDIPETDIDLNTGLPETDSMTDNDLPELDITDDNFGDLNWKDYFADSSDNSANNSEWEEISEEDRRTDTPSVDESLQDHLLWQLRMSTKSEHDYEIGEAIIGEINDNGYLTTDIKEIAESSCYELADVERLLKLIQSFEPTGVGARDLKECLLIQLNQMELDNLLPYKLIEDNYLENLAFNKHPQIAKSLKVNIDSIREASKIISMLEPEPGRQFSPVRNEYIIPDVIIDKIDDKYNVLMNDYGPRLGISSYYRDILVSKEQLSDDTKKFIQSKLESALWFLENLERRRKTIQKVTQAIFDFQSEFLDKGARFLKPLTYKDVADVVGIHEATVSRTVRGRYVQTPRGIFELKHFFSSGISTQSGEMASSTGVKEIIKNVIENENPKRPLSDLKIGKILSQKGYNIARRTISKYREELNIPPSNKRKQW